jgi:beta-lactam-binding protein with PASTA domain
MRRLWRQTWLRGLAIGLVVLLLFGVAALHTTSPSLGRPNTYMVINPYNGQVIASGPNSLSGDVVTLNPKTGRIVQMTGQSFPSGTVITLNPKTGQIVKASR